MSSFTQSQTVNGRRELKPKCPYFTSQVFHPRAASHPIRFHSFIHSLIHSFIHSFLVLIANLQGLIYGALGTASHKQGPSPNEPTGVFPIILMVIHLKKQNLGVLLMMEPESSLGKCQSNKRWI